MKKGPLHDAVLAQAARLVPVMADKAWLVLRNMSLMSF